jgi:hypothetical protein
VEYKARVLFQPRLHVRLFVRAVVVHHQMQLQLRETQRLKRRRNFIYLAPKVFLIDEVGYLPLDDLGTTIFFQLVSARYERSSIILTSNKSYGDWGAIFGAPIISRAIQDRFLHQSTTINIRGESYRLKGHRKALPVPPREQERATTSHFLASASVAPRTRRRTALGSTAPEAKEAHT